MTEGFFRALMARAARLTVYDDYGLSAWADGSFLVQNMVLIVLSVYFRCGKMLGVI